MDRRNEYDVDIVPFKAEVSPEIIAGETNLPRRKAYLILSSSLITSDAREIININHLLSL